MCQIRALVCWALILVAVGVGGCCKEPCCIATYDVYDKCYWDVDPIQTAYNAIDCLLRQTSRSDPTRRVLVATAVDLDDLQRTSRFGRMTSQFFASRLAHHGYSVVHMTLRKSSVVIRGDGEFLLSRDMKDLTDDYDAGAVLVTTYTAVVDRVYITVKLVNAASSELLGAVDYAIPRGRRTQELLEAP